MNRLVPVSWFVQNDGFTVAVIDFVDGEFEACMTNCDPVCSNGSYKFATLDEAYQAVLKQMGL